MKQHAFRLPDDVLDEAREVAQQEGTSVDTLVSAIVSEALRHRRQSEQMRQRASRGNPNAALAILDSLPSLPTDEWDEMPGNPSDVAFGMDRR